MRETAKAADDAAMTFGMAQPGLAEAAVQRDGKILIFRRL